MANMACQPAMQLENPYRHIESTTYCRTWADLHPTLQSAAVTLPLEIEVEVKYSALKRAFEALLVRVFPLLIYDTKG